MNGSLGSNQKQRQRFIYEEVHHGIVFSTETWATISIHKRFILNDGTTIKQNIIEPLKIFMKSF